ncbi:shieldin complex subunit 1 isoform X2 [Molossus molossus]|uniref:shieldin complex subunit 1 isoform X2 n=1 Tax=Molossus molossus TaxID=27622 RepID=UPI001746D8E6|nr:shieldin complex subunit 1 isoform X2 [Molossus molossus]
MAAQQATPGSQSEESSTLELPSACDIRDYMLREHSQEAHSETVSSVEALSIPSSSEVDPDSSNVNTTQNDSWTSENFWLDPSVKSQPETKTEEDGLRKSLDTFYEMFGRPQPASGDALSTSVCRCLSQKINELKDQENQKDYFWENLAYENSLPPDEFLEGNKALCWIKYEKCAVL